MTPEQKAKYNGNQPAGPRAATVIQNTGRIVERVQDGLNKREAFAMAALQGLASQPFRHTKELAEYAVKIADDLLLALEKHDDQTSHP